jgi:choline kinase/8-oxo-dGTP pyrophosphatase MutT (NUDIX family)
MQIDDKNIDRYSAILLGAGNSARMKNSQGKPKWMLDIYGQSIVQHILNVLNSEMINKNTILVGSKGGSVINPSTHIRHIYNTKNMLQTLFSASELLIGEIVVSYCDVIFEPRVLRKLMDTDADLAVVVDTNWLPYYSERFVNWREDAETCLMTNNHTTKDILEIGQPIPDGVIPEAQYIGLLKFSARGIEKAQIVYQELLKSFLGKPWRNSQTFESAYMTDFIQELILTQDFIVKPVMISGGWLEFDTDKDYLIAKKNDQSYLSFDALCNFPVVVASGGVVHKLINGIPHVLLVGTGKQNEWRIPKGIVEPKETIKECAVREILEETGHSVECKSYIGRAQWNYKYNDLTWNKYTLFFIMNLSSDTVLGSDAEHEVVKWFELGKAREHLKYVEEERILNLAAEYILND